MATFWQHLFEKNHKNNKIKKKKLFLINSYGIYNLNTYLKYGSNKKLKSLVKNMANSNVKKVVNKWK